MQTWSSLPERTRYMKASCNNELLMYNKMLTKQNLPKKIVLRVNYIDFWFQKTNCTKNTWYWLMISKAQWTVWLLSTYKPYKTPKFTKTTHKPYKTPQFRKTTCIKRWDEAILKPLSMTKRLYLPKEIELRDESPWYWLLI